MLAPLMYQVSVRMYWGASVHNGQHACVHICSTASRCLFCLSFCPGMMLYNVCMLYHRSQLVCPVQNTFPRPRMSLWFVVGPVCFKFQHAHR